MARIAELTSRNKGQAFLGYHLRGRGEPDAELSRVGPGTPCGEYLRRFWHPVELAENLRETPLRVRIMGEDLVLFRDQEQRTGLVHLNCPHRLASLEYGTCEQRGLRCCYHGWLFDVDGTLLDTPGQPEEIGVRLRQNVRLGAYPVKEYKGLVFAYMGPPENQPPFPIYDSFDIPNMVMTPYKADFRCNWLQVLDAILDPIHTSFLHARISRAQFSEALGELGVLGLYERKVQLLSTNTRRVGDNVWVRVNELIFPNFTQAGAAFATDGSNQRYFGRSAFTRWVVPVDDENTLALAWGCFGERGDPVEWNTPEGCQLIEQGELFNRPYAERQRYPGDAEAVEGMGPITVHADEHLAPSDRGIAIMRRRLRKFIKDLQNGSPPPQPTSRGGPPVCTFGGDTVLKAPIRSDRDDDAFLKDLAQQVMETQFAADERHGEDRDNWIIAELKALEGRLAKLG